MADNSDSANNEKPAFNPPMQDEGNQTNDGDSTPSIATPQDEVPMAGIYRSSTLPSRQQIAGQGEGTPPPNRRRGQTLSSAAGRNPSPLPPRVSDVRENERLGSIQEDRPLTNVRSKDEANPTSILRQRSTSQTSRRPRGYTLNRAPTGLTRTPTGLARAPTALVRRPTALTTGTDSQGEMPFTLAGPDTQTAQHQPYIEPGYAQLNPAYVQPTNNRPVWGLAKPLPRVLRPGMVPTPSELNLNQDQGGQQQQQSNAPPDLSDVERGQPSLRRAGTFQAVGDLRDQRENNLFRRGTQNGRRSTDTRRPSEIAGLAPHPEEREEHGDGAELGPSESMLSPDASHDFAESEAQKRYDDDDSLSDATEVENEDDWEPLQSYGMSYVEEEVHNHHTRWSIIRTRYREPLAEFLAAFVQLTLGFCADLAISVAKNNNNFDADYAWGFATMCGIYIAGGISGAHLNPAISIMLWVYRGFPLRKIPPYVIAQLLAAFCAALLSYGLYRNAIIAYDGSLSLDLGGTATSFVTSKREATVDPATAFFTEFVGTAFLAVVVLALGDDSNAPPGAGMNALVLGLVITVLCMAFGYNTGAALNPSRDLGPRLALLALGYGSELFTDPYWFYAPIVGCITGAIVGGGLYDIAIFVGGESPINYPRKRIWRAGHKFKKRMAKRLRRQTIPDTLR